MVLLRHPSEKYDEVSVGMIIPEKENGCPKSPTRISGKWIRLDKIPGIHGNFMAFHGDCMVVSWDMIMIYPKHSLLEDSTNR